MHTLADALRTKFGRDLVFNLGAFAIVGVAGIAINVIIGRQYGAVGLGVFSQLFALHIALSQIAVLGVHFSVLRHVAEYAHDSRSCGMILGTGLLAASVPALTLTALAWLLIGPVGDLFDSEGVRQGMPWIVAAVWLFACNKVLISALNGAREMRNFAIAQGGRFIVMLALLVWLVALRAPSHQLVAVVFGAECVLLLYLSYSCARRFRINLSSRGDWVRNHLRFGARAFLSGSMSELNSRVDIVVLGVFASDNVVGVYSFAATIVEGLSQLPIVLRNNLNPLITQAFSRRERASLMAMAVRARRATYISMAAVLGATAMLFPLFVDVVMGGEGFGEASMILLILCVGLWIGSGYLPLDMYLVQCGFPGWQSCYKAVVLITNIALSLAFIPMLGAYGAAIATAMTWAFAAICLRWLGRAVTGVVI